MNAQIRQRAYPLERGIAWVMTFLLAGCLVITILSILMVQILTNAGLHLGVATWTCWRKNMDFPRML